MVSDGLEESDADNDIDALDDNDCKTGLFFWQKSLFNLILKVLILIFFFQERTKSKKEDVTTDPWAGPAAE